MIRHIVTQGCLPLFTAQCTVVSCLNGTLSTCGVAGLRQRFPGLAGNRQGNDQYGQPAAAPHRRHRTRTITFRISARTLLQALVFGMVLYQVKHDWSATF